VVAEVESHGLWGRGLPPQNDVLLQRALSVSITHVSFYAGEGVGIKHLVGGDQFALGILKLGDDHALAAGGVVICKS